MNWGDFVEIASIFMWKYVNLNNWVSLRWHTAEYCRYWGAFGTDFSMKYVHKIADLALVPLQIFSLLSRPFV